MDDLSAKIESVIRRERLFSRNQRILVGVSGGVDSVVLLHLLIGMAERFHWGLGVVHLNHGLRGRASGADARFVKGIARSLELPCFSSKAEVKKLAATKKVSLEMAAREARHDLFRKAAKEFQCRTLALAHHGDDQVEQFFLRLFRGAGLDGLSGMAFKSTGVLGGKVNIVRPLLAVSRTEIESFASTNRIRHREDASNRDDSISRNRIRQRLLPLLEDEYSSAIRVLVSRSMELLKGDQEALAWVLDEWSAGRLGDGDFSRLPVGLKRRIVMARMREQGMDADFASVNDLVRRAPSLTELDALLAGSGMDGEGQITGPSSGFEAGELAIDAGLTAKVVKLPSFRAEIVRKPVGKYTLKQRRGRERFDAGAVGDRLVFRHWRAGDRYRPIGMNGSRKLQDCFTDAGVAKHERHRRAVLTTGDGRILWVEGLRIDERFKVTAETREILELRWKRTG